MTAWGDAAKAANEALRLYYTIEKNVKDIETNSQQIRTDVSGLRLEIIGLVGRISVLEEGRRTIAAEVKAEMAEGLSEIKALKAETVAQLKVDYANEVSKLLRQNWEYQRELEKLIAPQRQFSRPEPPTE